jgi:hypothetical protein
VLMSWFPGCWGCHWVAPTVATTVCWMRRPPAPSCLTL